MEQGYNSDDSDPFRSQTQFPYDTDSTCDRTETPRTEITDLPLRPDITMYCNKCRIYVDLRSLNEHRAYHKALQTMKFKITDLPEDLKALQKRRMGLMRRLKKKAGNDTPLDMKDVTKIDAAFDLLKASIEDTYEALRQVRHSVNTDLAGVALNCSTACAYSVGICSDQNGRWKSTMEDTRVYQDYFGNDTDKCFYAIYDGHNGRFAADTAASELHHAMLCEMSKFDPKTKCTCTFNMADDENAKVSDIHRPVSKDSERVQLYEASTHLIQQIIHNCEDNLDSLKLHSGRISKPNTPKTPKTAKTPEEKATNQENNKKQKGKKHKEKDPFSERVSNAFKTAYRATDLLLSYGKDESSRVRWSGCSALTCIIQNTHDAANIDNLIELDEASQSNIDENEEDRTPRKPKPPVQLGLIHLANAGNVHALLVRDNKPYMLSKDHTPKNPKELSRVVKEGGTVNDSKKEPRVNGILATTRGLGNHGDPALKKVVLTDPYTTTVKIDQYAQYLVLASHGLWEVFSEQEVTDLVVQMLPQNAYPAPSVCSTSINLLLAEYHRDLQSRMYAATYTEDAIKSGKYSVASSEYQSRPNTGKLSTISKDSHKTTNTTVSSIPNSKISGNTGGKIQGSHSIILEQDEANGGSPISNGHNQNINLAVCDLQTEVGSQIDVSDDERDDDSGHEGDIDTCTDFVSIPAHSRLTGVIPPKAELHREFSRMISERLVKAALLAGAKDNITVMVIMLPGCGL